MKKYLMATTLLTALVIAAGCQKKPRVADSAPAGQQPIQQTSEEKTTQQQDGDQDQSEGTCEAN